MAPGIQMEMVMGIGYLMKFEKYSLSKNGITIFNENINRM
jgi:hypothetical protein